MAKKKEELSADAANKESEELAKADLIGDACDAYGIDDEYLFGSAILEDGVVVLITAGGSKVFWKPGRVVETPLTSIQITGINPANQRRKPITGGKR